MAVVSQPRRVSNAEYRTLLLRANALHADEQLRLCQIIPAIHKVFQRHQTLQWFSRAITNGLLTLLAIITVAMDQEVTTPVALRKDARKQWRLVRCEVAVLAIRDVWCPDPDELAETESILQLRVP